MQPSKQDSVSKLIFELSKLPGIGEKTATRLSHYILKQDPNYARSLAEAIVQAKQKTQLCGKCFNFTDVDPCRICSNPNRNNDFICVVEKPSDVFAIEQAGIFRGAYHVLHGALSPLDGIGPEELKIQELLNKLAESKDIREIILATNPSVEGEATALYLARLIKSMGAFHITKLAHGLPVGGLLEYTDKQTLSKALENRMEMG